MDALELSNRNKACLMVLATGTYSAAELEQALGITHVTARAALKELAEMKMVEVLEPEVKSKKLGGKNTYRASEAYPKGWPREKIDFPKELEGEGGVTLKLLYLCLDKKQLLQELMARFGLTYLKVARLRELYKLGVVAQNVERGKAAYYRCEPKNVKTNKR